MMQGQKRPIVEAVWTWGKIRQGAAVWMFSCQLGSTYYIFRYSSLPTLYPWQRLKQLPRYVWMEQGESEVMGEQRLMGEWKNGKEGWVERKRWITCQGNRRWKRRGGEGSSKNSHYSFCLISQQNQTRMWWGLSFSIPQNSDVNRDIGKNSFSSFY